MLGNYCRSLGNYVTGGITPQLARFGIQPWMMNLCCVVSAIGSGYFFFSNNIKSALVFLFFNGLFDYMDGAISRSALSFGREPSRYDPILHILADKVSEIAIFGGMTTGKIIRWELGLLAIATCLLLTVVGRWVEHKGIFNLERSWFDRADRFVILLVFCSLRHFQAAVILVSILNISGIVQRLWAYIGVKLPKQ